MLIGSGATGTVVPAKVRSVRWYAPLTSQVAVLVRRRPHRGGLCADIAVMDPDGAVLFELSGVEFESIGRPAQAAAELAGVFYETAWELRDDRDERVVAAEEAGESTLVVDLATKLSTRARAIAAAHQDARLLAIRRTDGSPGRDDVASAVRDLRADPGCTGVLVVVVADTGQEQQDTDPTTAGVDAVTGLVAVAQGVEDAVAPADDAAEDGTQHPADGPAVRGVVVTEHAHLLAEDRCGARLSHTALTGARRVLRNEQTAVQWRLVDVESDTPVSEIRAELAGGSYADDDAHEVCLAVGCGWFPCSGPDGGRRMHPGAPA